MKTRILFGALLAAILAVPAVGIQEEAQTPAESSEASSESQEETAPATATSSREGEQRRDPFRTTIIPKAEEGLPTRLPPGKKGLVIGQLQVQGIARSIDGRWIAVVDNNTQRAYFLREKDELYNGVVSKITPDSVVFLEEVSDARGRKSSREIVKRLPPD